jgi:hypothetical protein
MVRAEHDKLDLYPVYPHNFLFILFCGHLSFKKSINTLKFKETALVFQVDFKVFVYFNVIICYDVTFKHIVFLR